MPKRKTDTAPSKPGSTQPSGGLPANRRGRERLISLVRGYAASQAIATAVELGIFQSLSRSPSTVTQLARRLSLDRRGTRALTDALCTLGLLLRNGDYLHNSMAAEQFLIPGKENSLAEAVLHQKHLYERWLHLAQCVRTGKPAPAASKSPRGRMRFHKAMIASARSWIEEVTSKLDLGGCRSLLDLGGGAGACAAQFARRWPQLTVTVLDVPEVEPLARELLRKERLEGRVVFRAGDATRDRLGGPYDAVFISNVLHIFSRATMKRIIRKAARSLSPGGRLVIKEYALTDDRTGPANAGLFALNMLVATEAGGVCTESEIKAMVTSAGLKPTAEHRLRNSAYLLEARRIK